MASKTLRSKSGRRRAALSEQRPENLRSPANLDQLGGHAERHYAVGMESVQQCHVRIQPKWRLAPVRQALLRDSFVLEDLPHLLRRDRNVDVRDTEVPERIDD